MTTAEQDKERILAELEQWLDAVVIGQQLCPFAARPRQQDAVRIVVSASTDPEQLLQQFYAELMKLADSEPAALETTLMVVPALQASFDDYWEFVGVAESLLEQSPWRGQFQVASFHPQYIFEGCEADDPANYSNRSPWPILHLLREDSVAAAIASHPDVSAIPERNVELLRAMESETLRALFPWHFAAEPRPNDPQ